MNTTFSTVPLIEEHLRQFASTRIVVARIFESPHLWYAGIVRGCALEEADVAIINFSSSIRFERQGTHDPRHPGDSLIRMTVDTRIGSTKDSMLDFRLKEAVTMTDGHSPEDTGIIGIRYEGGFAHLSYRGPDVISITKLLQMR